MAASECLTARTRSSGTKQYVNAAYYPSWKVFRKEFPSCMNLDCLTHVFYAFSRVREDGSLYMLDEYADTKISVDGASGCFEAFRLHKQSHPHLKVVLSIGGGSGSPPFPKLAADPVARTRLAEQCREFVDQHDLDGIDVDWEHPSTPQQGHSYSLLLQTLRSYLPSPAYLLTTALPAGEWCLRNLDLATVATHLDMLNLMCYDFAGSWTGLSGHQAQLFAPPNPANAYAKRSGHSGVQYLLDHSVPAEKVLMGIPAYGRSFLGVSSPGQKFSGHAGEQGIFDFKHLPRPGSIERVDHALVAAWCEGGDGGWVTYDNPETVRRKADYVKRHGLAGVFFWTGVSSPKGERDLVETTYRALGA